jgi:hypothetical protein
MRRTAIILNIHRTTVMRKLLYLAERAKEKHQQFLRDLPKVKKMQFDDLITIEHTKCKPLSVSMAVEEPSRRILDFEVSVIPASGHLADIARKKYGPRPNQKPEGLHRLFKKLKAYVAENATLSSDEDNLYPLFVKKYFPRCI